MLLSFFPVASSQYAYVRLGCVNVPLVVYSLHQACLQPKRRDSLKQNIASWLRFCLVRLGICLSMLVGTSAYADMVIDSTRIIYPQGRRDVQVTLINSSAQIAAFVQLWLDDGTGNQELEPMAVPFVLSPPTARVVPNGRQTVRLTYTGEPLRADQESVFWFNMLELPPAYKGPTDVDRVTFARRTRIKVFFRPKGLTGDPLQAMTQLQCSPTKSDGKWALECYNASSFHLSFFGFSLGNAAEKVRTNDLGGMIKPRERVRFELKDFETLPQPLTTLTMDFVNDYGGVTTLDSTLRSAP